MIGAPESAMATLVAGRAELHISAFRQTRWCDSIDITSIPMFVETEAPQS
jgi:hypothetical protein